MLGSHFFSTKALRKAVIQVDKNLRKAVATVNEEKTDTERVWSNNYDRVVGCLNAFGGITFIFGTFFASVFFYLIWSEFCQTSSPHHHLLNHRNPVHHHLLRRDQRSLLTEKKEGFESRHRHQRKQTQLLLGCSWPSGWAGRTPSGLRAS